MVFLSFDIAIVKTRRHIQALFLKGLELIEHKSNIFKIKDNYGTETHAVLTTKKNHYSTFTQNSKIRKLPNPI